MENSIGTTNHNHIYEVGGPIKKYLQLVLPSILNGRPCGFIMRFKEVLYLFSCIYDKTYSLLN